MSFALIRSFKEAKTLLKFTFGNVGIYATTWKSPIYWKGASYSPEPGIGVTMPKQSGGLNEDPLQMTLPLNRQAVHPQIYAMSRQLASSRAAPRLHLSIAQLIVDGSDQKLAHVYEGTLERSRANPNGKQGILEAEFTSELRYGLANITLGRRCDPECDVRFGGNGCFHPAGSGATLLDASTYYPNQVPVDQATVRSGWVDLTVDVNNPRKVYASLNATQHPTPASTPPVGWRILTISEMEEGYWIGSFFKDTATGLSIPIQSWEQGTNEFILSQLPPSVWDGSTVLLQVDCPKTAAGCRGRFNEDDFNGLGFGIPDYNPSLDIRNRS